MRVDDDGAIVSAHGPLTPVEVGAALRDTPTTADEETDAAPLDHLRAVTLDREAEYLSLAPYRQPSTGHRDEGGDGA